MLPYDLSPLGGGLIDLVYEYYDRPVLFTVLNPEGRRYLVVLVESEPEEWLCAYITDAELESMEDGQVDVRSAFLNSSEVFWVTGNASTLRDPANLEDAHLPEEGVLL